MAVPTRDAAGEPLASSTRPARRSSAPTPGCAWLLAGVLLLAGVNGFAGQRFLGSPDGSYKVTLITTDTGTQATMQRLLIPNRTLWQRPLPGGAGPHSGYVSNSGQLIVINKAAQPGDVVVVVVSSAESATVEYQLAEVSELIAQHGGGALTPEQWNQVEVRPQAQGGVLVTHKDVDLLVTDAALYARSGRSVQTN